MAKWSDLAEWWLEEVDDPAYAEEVLPLMLRMLDPQPGELYADLGCGEGRVMAAIADRGIPVIGVDLNLQLLRHARSHGPVVAARLPDLSFLRPNSLDGAYVVLALEHIHDMNGLFDAVARCIRPDGRLAVVLNHPIYTAPDSGPVLDPTDGEIFWRFGRYLGGGSTHEPAGRTRVEFVHRSMSELLNAASAHGWSLACMEERPVGVEAAQRDPLLAKHGDIPHLLAVRWTLLPQR